MMVGEVEGRFLEFLVRLMGAKRVLELGTFTGYSSLSMARGLPEGGRVITCDVNAETNAIAQRYAEEAGLADRIEYRLGPARRDDRASSTGRSTSSSSTRTSANYIDYYEAVLPKLADERADPRRQRVARRTRARRGCGRADARVQRPRPERFARRVRALDRARRDAARS